MRTKFRLGLAASGVGLILLAIGGGAASAASASISRSYQAASPIQTGSIVSFNPNKSNYVEAANTDNDSRLAGVAVSPGDSLVAVDNGGKVQVAISGSVSTLASDVNGDIGVGDQVSASPFSGIGMLASSGGHVIGVAQTALNAKTPGAKTQTVKDRNGRDQQVRVGYIRVSIAVGATDATGSKEKLNVLQRVARSLTGHTISTVRILLALVIIIVATVSLAALVHASIYGSIVSVGRNPLAKHAIFRTLTSVLVMSLLLTAVAVAATFFLLR